MKPRLTIEYSITQKRKIWFCRGSGRLAMGDTSKDAYYNWKWLIKERGIIL